MAAKGRQTIDRVLEWQQSPKLAFEDWNRVHLSIQAVIKTLTPEMEAKEDDRRPLLLKAMNEHLTSKQHSALADMLKFRWPCPVRVPQSNECTDRFAEMSFEFTWAISEFQSVLAGEELIASQTQNPLLQFVSAFDQKRHSDLIVASKAALDLKTTFQVVQDQYVGLPFDHRVLEELAMALLRLTSDRLIRMRDWTAVLIGQAQSSLEAIRLARWLSLQCPDHTLLDIAPFSPATSEDLYSGYWPRSAWWAAFDDAQKGADSYCKTRRDNWIRNGDMQVDPSASQRGKVRFRLAFLRSMNVKEPQPKSTPWETDPR